MAEGAMKRPTWELIPFDQGTDMIPTSSKEKKRGFLRTYNPLDKKLVYCFSSDESFYNVYYLPKTGETIPDTYGYYDRKQLSTLFRTYVRGSVKVENRNRYVLKFSYEMILDERYVCRVFEHTTECKKVGEKEYRCEQALKELYRFVFYKDSVVRENRDQSCEPVSIKDIPRDILYDTLYDAGKKRSDELDDAFEKSADIVNKEIVKKAMPDFFPRWIWHMKELCLYPFCEAYEAANESGCSKEDIPEKIWEDLSNTYSEDGECRLAARVSLVVGKQAHKYYKLKDEVRVYFDCASTYFLRKSTVTGQWIRDDVYYFIAHNDWASRRKVKITLFDNTCLERYADYAPEESAQVVFGDVLAMSGYLFAEQAGKMGCPVYGTLIHDIFRGNLCDPTLSLPEVFGITGPQLKYLNDSYLPNTFGGFAELMNDDDFKRVFPDVRKRLFAVSFYSYGGNKWVVVPKIPREDIFMAAKTLNAIERSISKGKVVWFEEYGDYLRMHRKYRNHMKQLRKDNPLYDDVVSYGEVPLHIKPSQLHYKIVDKLHNVLDLFESAELIAEYDPAIKKRYDKESKTVEYSDGRYSIIMPRTAKEIISEGRALHHCVGVGGYIARMARNQCTILFLRSNKEIDKPFLTIEESEGYLCQCYGFRNKVNDNPEIRDFLKHYCEMQGLKVNTVIYSPKDA